MKKTDNINQPARVPGFWFCAGILAILLSSILARDIDRPFYGLHSWAEAAAAWRAKCYLKYDLKYTKGLAVWAVGNPPTENPNRSLDHPQLGLFLPALDMIVFGINEQSVRIGAIMRAIICLWLFLRILRGLSDDYTALLAGVLFILFPVTGYFGTLAWIMPVHLLYFLALWCYLVLIGAFKQGPEAKALHKWGLALSLFFILQLRWEGFFYALSIGVHYVCRCIYRRQFPEKTLLAILIIAPLSSLMLDFAIMAAGHGWQWRRIWELYKWRAAKGEMPEFVWSRWFQTFWKFAILDFTLPALIIAIAYLTIGQLLIFTAGTKDKIETVPVRRFPQFWLILMPGMFQLLILRGALWRHQYWEFPLVPFIAIAAAMAIMLLADLLRKINRKVANTVAVLLVVMIFISCMKGLNYYYAVRWHEPAEIKMFKDFNKKIPPDKALLSFGDFIVNQNTVKGPHYLPEIAWYLDREIVAAQTMKDIEQKARTGRYPFYLIPFVRELEPLINQLKSRYIYELIPGIESESTKDGKLRAGMYTYYIFDLNRPVKGG